MEKTPQPPEISPEFSEKYRQRIVELPIFHTKEEIIAAVGEVARDATQEGGVVVGREYVTAEHVQYPFSLIHFDQHEKNLCWIKFPGVRGSETRDVGKLIDCVGFLRLLEYYGHTHVGIDIVDSMKNIKDGGEDEKSKAERLQEPFAM